MLFDNPMRHLLFLLCLPLYGAASLTVSGPSLASDGVTLTVPLSGCTSPLSPSSGILGFTAVSNLRGGTVLTISTAAASGCTVTLTLSEPVSRQEAPVTITLASTTGANYLTDASANTPAGSSNVSVANNSDWLYVTSSAFLSNARAEGYHLSSSQYPNQLEFLSADGCLRFNSTTTKLDIFTFNFGNHWVLRQDGTQVFDWGVSAGAATWTSQGLVSGLSGSHEYAVCSVAAQSPYPDIFRIRIDAGTLGVRPAAKKLIAAAGDSLRQYYGAQSLTDSRLGDVFQVANALGAANQYYGLAGAQICNLTTSIPTKLTFPNGENFAVALLAWSGGGNDVSAGATPPQLAACYTTLLNNITGLANPPRKIIVEGLPPEATPYSQTYDDAIKSVVAGYANAVFVSTTLPVWINNTVNAGNCSDAGDRQTDGIHIEGCAAGTHVGYSKVADIEQPIVYSALTGSPTYSFSGPITGTVGLPVSFTITLATGRFSGVVTLTPSDGSGGKFSPAGVTPTSGSSTTIVYTPIGAGSKTIRISASADTGWVSPAGSVFTATPATSIQVPRNFLLAQ